MANEKYIKGFTGNLAVWVPGVSPALGAYKPVVCLTESSHELVQETIDKVNMCTLGQTIQTVRSVTESATISGEVVDLTSLGGDTTQVTVEYLKSLSKAQVNDGPNIFRLSRGSGFLYFSANLSNVSDSYSADSDATFSATLAIQGSSSSVDPNA